MSIFLDARSPAFQTNCATNWNELPTRGHLSEDRLICDVLAVVHEQIREELGIFDLLGIHLDNSEKSRITNELLENFHSVLDKRLHPMFSSICVLATAIRARLVASHFIQVFAGLGITTESATIVMLKG